MGRTAVLTHSATALGLCRTRAGEAGGIAEAGITYAVFQLAVPSIPVSCVFTNLPCLYQPPVSLLTSRVFTNLRVFTSLRVFISFQKKELLIWLPFAHLTLFEEHVDWENKDKLLKCVVYS